ncbi:V-type ATP synthase subunit I [Verrucomicrobiota bacterium]
MKKVTVLCLEKDKNTSLPALQDMGILHLSNIQKPDSTDLSSAVTELNNAESALSLINKYDLPSSEKQTADANKIIDQILDIQTKRQKLIENKTGLTKEEETCSPLGNFEPDTIRQLSAKGILVKLYTAPSKVNITAPEQTELVPLSKDATNQYFAIISEKEFEFDAKEISLPKRSLSEIRNQIKNNDKCLDELENEIRTFVNAKKGIEQAIILRKEKVALLNARDGMGLAGTIAYLQGFCPEGLVEKLQNEAATQGWGLVIEEPGEEDRIPTLIKYPAWVKPIKSVFDGLALLPGYREADISMVFMIFFSIFFAMLIGDAGYGLLFLVITILARIKNKKAPFYPFALFGILSIATIIWGVMTVNYFGISPEYMPQWIRSLSVGWLIDDELGQKHLMKLCFLIGSVHLTIAHAWNAIVLFPNKKWIAQIGWIGIVWFMFYTALNMVVGEPYPSWTFGLLIGGLLAVILFMTERKDFKKEIVNHFMLPLSVVSCFVDIISYIRLFAVGMASAAVAQSFNNMAMGLGVSKIWTIPIIAVILLIGHGLNILLCALGILVHGVRLNTLEFSVHKGLEWTGIKYKPFTKLSNNKV